MSITLMPGSTSLAQLESLWRDGDAISLDPSAHPAMQAAADLVARAAAGNAAVYGVNTGFGKLASIKIAPADTEALQRNLILSHCCGVGESLDVPVRIGECTAAVVQSVENVLWDNRAGVRQSQYDRAVPTVHFDHVHISPPNRRWCSGFCPIR